MKKFYLLLLTFVTFFASYAQVTVTAPALTVSGCSFPTAYSSLGNIVISEKATDDISVTGDFILTVPTNFEFQPLTGTVTTTGGDLTISGVTIGATTIAFTITVNSTTNLDVITISGIQVRGISVAGPSNILRTPSGGTDATVAGDVPGGVVNHGTLTSTQYPSPNVTNPNTATACSGASPNIALTASVPSSFSWTIGTITGGITGASAASGSTINQVLTNPGNSAAGTVQYIVTPTSTTGSCAGAPYTITVTVNPAPAVTNANTAITCSGTSPNIGLTASVPSTFLWTIGTITGGITGASGSSGSTINQILTNPSNTTAGSVQYIVTPTATTGSCPGAPYTITVTVNPAPAVTNANTASTCSGTSPNIALTASVPSSFSWTIGTVTGGITGASGNSGTTINQILTNPSNTTAGSVQYIVTPTATTGSCAGAPYTITVTVNPAPVVTNPNTATTCSGTSPNIALTASVPSTFSWTIGTVTGGITGASAASGSTINQVLTNPSNSAVGTVQYIITPTATTGACAGPSYTITVTVNPAPAVTNPNSATTCSGTGPNIALTASVPSTFSWTIGSITGGITGASAASGSTINQVLTNPSNSAAGTVQYIVTPTATTGSCPGSPYTITVTVNPAPIVTNPNTATICSGASTGITLSASVASNYAWTLGTITGGITGASASSGPAINQILTNPSNTTAGSVQYIVTPTATTGSCPGSPYTITVTVNPNPVVTNPNTATICSGASTGITLSASVASNYTWTLGTITGGITGASAGSGPAINQILTDPSNITAGSVQYIVTPTATTGSCPGSPYTITVTVNPNPVVTNPNTATICSGASTGITLSASVASNYTWTLGTITGGITGASAGSGPAINQILTNPGANTAPGTVQYMVSPTSTSGSCPGTPYLITVTVNPVATVNAVADQTVCNGGPTAAVTFGTPTTGGTVVYNWTNSAGTGIGLAASGTGNLPSFNAINAGALPVTTTITVTPSYTNGATCTGTPITFQININPTPAVNQPADQFLCAGASSAQVTFSGGPAGTLYNWINNNTSINLAASGSGNIPSFAATNPGAATIVGTIQVTPTANTCPGPTKNFNITVYPTATVNPITNQGVCNGAKTTAVTFGSPVSGTTYSWANDQTSIGLAASGTQNNIPAFTAINNGASPVIAHITVTPTANGCPGTPLTFTITVNPTPTVNNPGPQLLCTGSTFPGLAFTGTAGATFTWTNDNTTIGLSASGSGNLPSFAATNTTSSASVGNIAVTPTANTCMGAPVSFTITVKPAPAITSMSDATCSGSTFSELPVDTTNGVVPAGTTYTWSVPVVTGGITGGAAGGPGASITGTLTNPSATNQNTATYTVTPTAGTCPGPSFQLVITVNPNPPKGDASFFQNCTSNQQTICNGQQVGGGGQNDVDVETQPGCVQPATGQWDNPGWDYDWEYSNSGIAGPYLSAPTILGTHYQGVMPPYPSVFSTLGDHYIRFRLTNNYGCTSYSDTITLTVTSTLNITAGGPYVTCSSASPGSILLSGASITGTANSTIGGYWTISSGGGSLTSNNTFTTRPDTVHYTPAANFVGTAKLILTSIDPDGPGICHAVFDTAFINVQSSVSGFSPCTALIPANWTTANTNSNGYIDVSQTGCGVGTLVGSDNNSGAPGTIDYTICTGKGNFIFNWSYIAPVTASPVPLWIASDNQSNAGAGGTSFTVNKPTNLVAGNLIIVTIHLRRNPGSFTTIPAGFNLIRNQTSGSADVTTQATVASFYKIATAAEPANYTFVTSNGNTSNWRIEAGRITGASTTTPIGASNGTSKTNNSGTITVNSINTTQNNSLLVAALTVTGSIGNPFGGGSISPTGMTTVYNNNTQTTARVATMGIGTAGATGAQTFNWRNNYPSAAQMFVINPAVSVIEGDTAYTIVNGVQTLLTGKNGSSGSDTIAVNTGDIVGFRIRTTSNTGGPGKLTFFNLNVPNDTPKVTGTAAITIPGCNPPDPTVYFVAPTATDNCGSPSIVSGYPITGSPVLGGCNSNTQTRTWVFQDNCGLQSKPFVQTVTWTSDNVKPVLSRIADQNLCQAAGNNYTIPVLPAASDNCAGGIIYSYMITGATSRSGSGNDASGIFNSGISTIAWTATDGCGNFDTVHTTVTISPVATATISGTPASICSGSSATISVALTGTAPWSITYTNGASSVTVPNILTSPYTFSTGPLAANTTYSLTAVSDSRCNGTYSGNATITVRPLPTAVISGSTAICSGGSATISIAPTGSAPWTVTYTDGTTPVTTGIPSSPYTFVVSPAATTTYTITALSDANCSGTFSGSAVITVNPKPIVQVNGANPASASVCQGSGTGVTLIASGASTYSWSPATGLSATTGSTVTASPAANTTYIVTGTDGNNCVSTASVTVTINTPPTTAGASICQGDAGTIAASGCSGGGTFTTALTNAGAGADNASVGSTAWSTPNGITGVGAPYATQTFTGGAGPVATHYIQSSNYGFSIPAGSMINGITVVINRDVTVNTPNMRDFVVELVNGAGMVVGTNHANLAAAWPTSLTSATYGTAADTWGAGLSDADINSSNFGVVLSVSNSTGVSRTVNVDYIQISVTYTTTGSANWYTAPSGGNFLGSGSPFNPVGVAGSPLANTNTAGTTPFYAECSTAPGCRTLTNFVINPLPTITPAANTASVCQSSSAQSTTLTYTSTNAPTTYSITWNAAATSAGFAAVTDAALPASPIIIAVPANAGANTYTGTITVKNASTCVSSTGINFNVTVDPPTVGGTVPSVSVCTSGTGTLMLSGNVGNVVQWESSTDGGATWTVIVNNTTSLTYSASAVTTLYRALVQSGACASLYSNIATVGIHNVWTGVTSIDWNDGTNWSDGTVPTTSCPDVFIPGGTPFEPTLSGAPTATITNLHILNGAAANLIINGTGLMQIGGTISNNAFFDITNGTLELNGTTGAQNIAGSTFKNNVPGQNNTVKNLIISNNSNVNVANTPGDMLNITGTLSFGTALAGLNTGNNVTLKSSLSGTANLGVLTATNTITGNVTVERYIATGTVHPKAWQLLAIPTTGGQTIHQAWQENCGANANCNPGYGTQITGTGAGFDFATADPSMKTYNPATNDYTGVAGTGISIYNKKGYFLFVRGDRSVITAAAAATPTVLRTTGALYTPANIGLATTTITAGLHESLGNPYASAIDMRQVTRSGGADEFYYVWDPTLGGAYGYGGFRTLGLIGPDYYATPAGGIYSGAYNNLQSGQAFFMQATGSNGTVSFSESAKVNGSTVFTTPNPIAQPKSSLSISLTEVEADGSTNLVDGVLINFADTYSNDVDGMDARKMSNSGANLAIKTENTLLAIERRQPVSESDTIFLNLTGTRPQQYRFHFDAENLNPGLEGFLEDTYLNTKTPFGGSGLTDINFNVINVAGSYAAGRFMIVFAPQKALPVTFTSVKAYQQDKTINVEWRVENERNIKQYQVEKSVDGNQFIGIDAKDPVANNGGSAIYVVTDPNPVEGFNYYRIKSIDVNGMVSYSATVKVLINSGKQDIVINPNPITDGLIHLQLINQPAGRYGIRLLNNLGQVIISKQINRAAGSSTEILKWDYNLAHGMYKLEVTGPDGNIKNLNVMY